MRIVTKWCDQLWKNFEKEDFILNKEEQFRMRDGSQSYLNKTNLIILSKILQKEKKNIENYLKEVMENNYEHQSYFADQEAPK